MPLFTVCGSDGAVARTRRQMLFFHPVLSLRRRRHKGFYRCRCQPCAADVGIFLNFRLQPLKFGRLPTEKRLENDVRADVHVEAHE
jgi:hypothetical protein